MITTENEFYIRFVLLLIEGGTDVLRIKLKHEVEKEKGTFGNFLSSVKDKIQSAVHITKKQQELLYPVSKEPPDLNKCDISILAYLLNEFITIKRSSESKAVNTIKTFRNDFFAHPKTASLDAKLFNSIWNKLSLAILTLSHDFTENERERFKELIERLSNDALDINSAVETLRTLDQTDEFNENINIRLTQLDQAVQYCHKGIEMMMKQMTELQKTFENQGMSTKVVHRCCKPVKVAVKCSGLDSLKTALDVFGSGDEARNSFSGLQDALSEEVGKPINLQTAVDLEAKQIAIDNAKKGLGCCKTVKVVVKCSGLDSLKTALDVFGSGDAARNSFSGLQDALSEEVGKPINLQTAIDLEAKQIAIDNAKKELGCCKTVKVAVKCSGLDSLKTALDVFGSGDAARNSFSGLQDALSEEVGKPVNLQTAIDLEAMQIAIDNAKKELDIAAPFPRVVRPMYGSIVITAIDFGTACSGYAFAFRHEPLRIYTNEWNADDMMLFSSKAPTTVLLDPDGNFNAFGFEAEKMYSNLVDEDNNEGWYYFENFKMELYKQANLTRETLIEDIEGKKMAAMKVFSMSIEYMKSKVMEDAKDTVSGSLQDDEISWVLTVPALWSEPAKQFMREAANRAGIDNSRLRLVLEPEAACVYCQVKCMVRNAAGGIVELHSFPVDHTYIVADLGGGTADIATHKVLHGGKLRELYRVTRGDLGATRINRKFVLFLEEVFGKEVMKELKSTARQDYLEMMTDFEAKKKKVKGNSEEVMRVKFPSILTEIIEKHHQKKPKEILIDNNLEHLLVFFRGTLKLSSKTIDLLFKELVDEIVKMLTDIVKKQTVPIHSLLLVGGFADSPYLRSKITDEMAASSPEIKIVKPSEANLHVLKGAVLTTICPATITERISPFEYGLRTAELFDDKKHPTETKEFRTSGVYCADIFEKFIDKGRVLQTGEKINKRFEGPTNVKRRLESRSIELYRTAVPDTKYTCSEGCERVVRIVVDAPKDGWPDYTVFDVEIEVGETELHVSVINSTTGEMLNAKVDFLGS